MAGVDDTRAAWRARPPVAPLSGWSVHPRGLCVHYIGGPHPAFLGDHGQCLALVRQLQDGAFAGANGERYSDIPYNLAGCPHGRLIEARGLQWQGAAQKNANREYVSIVLLANVPDPLVPGLIVAANKARELVRDTFGGTELLGHRDSGGNPTGTRCPGDTIERWVQHPTDPEEDDMYTDADRAQASRTEVAAQGAREAALTAVDEIRQLDTKVDALVRANFPEGDPNRQSRLAAIVAAYTEKRGAIRAALDRIIAAIPPGPDTSPE